MTAQNELTDQSDFADDLLEGAAAIALYLFGTREKRRKVYYLAAHSRLPVFKLGAEICARRSVLRSWVENQERRHAGPSATPKDRPAPRDETPEISTRREGDV